MSPSLCQLFSYRFCEDIRRKCILISIYVLLGFMFLFSLLFLVAFFRMKKRVENRFDSLAKAVEVDVSSWPEVTGEIKESFVDERESIGIDDYISFIYKVGVKYEYSIKDVKYLGSRLGVVETWTEGRDVVASKLGRYPKGRTVRVRYNPNDCVQSYILE